MPAGFREKFIQQINPSVSENILDFGTGTAEIAILLKQAAPQANITAIDIDPKVLEIAKRKITSKNVVVKIIEYDGKVFPLSSNYFDKVVSCLVFHHLSPEQKALALAEIFRVLKPGGKIYISDWGLERNWLKAKFLNFYKYFDLLKYIVENGKGLLPQYMTKEGFKDVIESTYLKTITSTLCYYEGRK